MQKIIGRQQEINELKQIYASNKPEFVVVYGRRRVGKTFLIRELFNQNFAFYHTGLSPQEVDESNMMRSQLQNFASSLRLYGNNDVKTPSNWLEAFDMLRNELERKIKETPNERQVVFIDELPWMDTPRSMFVSALEHFWNGWAAGHTEVMLIVCGSATAWISDKLLHNKGGLYGRATREIKLHPLSLHEAEEFYDNQGIVMDRYSQMKVYMMLGGIPYYMSYLQKGLSFEQNMEQILTGKRAKLRDEFEQLFVSLFTNHQDCIKIIKLLATRRTGYTRNEIAQKTGLPFGGGLTKTLKALAESDFIKKYTYYGLPAKEERYRLIDFFTLYALSVNNKHVSPDSPKWQGKVSNKALEAWYGFSFESLCWYHIDQIKQALGITGVKTEEFSWRVESSEEYSGAQIDLIIRRADNVINICEMKFAASMYLIEKDDDASIRNKISSFQRVTKCQEAIHPILVTTYGLTQGKHSGIVQKVITMDDLFKS